MKAFIAYIFNDPFDLCQRHSIHCLARHASGHGSRIAVDFAIGFQIQFWIEQLPIDIFQRQLSLTSTSDDSQNLVGVSHLAYLLRFCSSLPDPLRHVTALPVADYYGVSVTLGLASRRRSRTSAEQYVSSMM